MSVPLCNFKARTLSFLEHCSWAIWVLPCITSKPEYFPAWNSIPFWRIVPLFCIRLPHPACFEWFLVPKPFYCMKLCFPCIGGRLVPGVTSPMMIECWLGWHGSTNQGHPTTQPAKNMASQGLYTKYLNPSGLVFCLSNFSAVLLMRSSLVLRMRSSLVVRAFDCQCTSCNGPGFDPSIRRHSGIWGAADEAVLNTVWKKIKKIPPKIF